MAQTATPYGLMPVNLIGGAPFNGGGIREIAMTVNSATAIFAGDVVAIGAASAGQPTALTATPTTSTVGVLGVCVGVRYTMPGTNQPMFANNLPANAITSGYTEVFIRVCDDPNQLYQVQASGAVARTAIGKNAPIGNFGGSTLNGRSSINLVAASIASTNTLGFRIVDLVNSQSLGSNPSTPGDAFTDCIVKFNFGVHTYQQAAGSTN